PIGPFGPYTDYVGPRFSLVTLLAALDQRRRTGAGCFIDVAQAEAGIAFLAPQIADFACSGRIARAQGNRDPEQSPHGVFRASGKDSWVAIAVRSDAQWAALASLVGGAPLEEDRRFIIFEARKANEDALENILADWALTRDAQSIEIQLQAAGIPAHVVAGS